MYGDTMKNLIFSIFSSINDNSTRSNSFFKEGDSLSKAQYSLQQFSTHKDRLIESKQKYAEHCNADFVLVENVDQHFYVDQFDSINFYKHQLIEKYCEQYDNILYLDFDVIPTTKLSFFETFDMHTVNVHAIDCNKQNTWSRAAKKASKRETYQHLFDEHFDRYHMYCKAKCKLAMLHMEDINSNDHHVANTGIIGGSSQALSQIQMVNRMDECMNTLHTAVEENMFGKEITQYFFANNETFYSYILDKYQIKWNNITPDWHTMLFDQQDYQLKHDLYNAKLVHVINKNFQDVWQNV